MLISKKKPSVLILGIDSLSRLNFHRQMPNTLQTLRDLGAVELLGLNKVGENTFPNVIPLFTGLSVEQLKEICWPSDSSYFDNCTFIWDKFKEKGYLTGFGEDTCWMGLFLYLKNGFRKQPTDFYTQPYMKQNEGEIGHTHVGNANLCSGSRVAFELIFDYAEKYAVNNTQENIPFWGHFWGTGLTHDYLNVPPNADKRVKALLKSLNASNVLENTLVIFMSDHGLRWGSFRETYQGYLEERLPYAFLMVPKWIRDKYPAAINNLYDNVYRLTSHYDLYATMMDLLDLNNFENNQSNATGKGISLFKKMPDERTCESAGIPENFCACHRSEDISTLDSKVNISAFTAVKLINDIIHDHPDCAQLHLDKVMTSRMQKVEGSDDEVEFLLAISTQPGKGIFESTVKYHNNTQSAEVVGVISRINAYGNDSFCVSHTRLKLYCYCI